MILGDFLKALGQLGDPRFRRVLWLGIALSLALLFGVYGAFLGLLDWLTPDTVFVPFFGQVTWVSDLLSLASIFLMLILSAFLMMPVASLFTSLFLDDVAAAVEAEHYPHLPPVGRLPVSEVFTDTLSFLGLLVVTNIAAFVLSVFFVPLAPFIFYGVNGYLLGREYFQIAAMRRLGRQGARQAFRDNRGPVFVAGLLMAVPLSVPLVNLVIPILGAATFTHLFHRLTAGGGAVR